jgi:integrase
MLYARKMKLVAPPLSLPLAAPAGPGPDLAGALEHISRGFANAAAHLRGQKPSGFHPVARPPAAAAIPAAPSQTWITVLDLVNEFLRAKARAGVCDRYLRQLRVTLKSFCQGRARRIIDQVQRDEVADWIAAHDWAPKTVRGHYGDLKSLFSFAQRRGYLAGNPAAGIELPSLDQSKPIQVHTPAQVAQLLEYARAADLVVCRILALRYFAGLRSAETHRLREEDLKLDQDLLEVPAAKSKTRSRRLVTIQPNLKAWLALGGELAPVGDMRIRAVIRRSGVACPHNVARHSFVSYHLAQFKRLNETILESGHSEQMLFKHYRALVTPTAAAEYWAIVPGPQRQERRGRTGNRQNQDR